MYKLLPLRLPEIDVMIDNGECREEYINYIRNDKKAEARDENDQKLCTYENTKEWVIPRNISQGENATDPLNQYRLKNIYNPYHRYTTNYTPLKSKEIQGYRAPDFGYYNPPLPQGQQYPNQTYATPINTTDDLPPPDPTNRETPIFQAQSILPRAIAVI